MKYTRENLKSVLKESNGIEMVYDDQSLEDSLATWDYLIQYDALSGDILRTAHKILMTNQPLWYRYKGDFRNEPVTIGGETKSLPRIVIDSLVRDLLESMNTSKNPEDCLMHHVQFESIHPFMDGNGRIGRLLLNWESVKRFNGELFMFRENEKFDYYKMFGS